MTHPFHHFATPDTVVTYFNEQSSNFPFSKVKATSAAALNGGNANRVYRINLQYDPTNEVAPSSVVFKYYAPFLAVDPSFPLSQDRYFVEKEALTVASTLFSSSDPKKAPLRVPRLYVTDDTNKVLLMEDAGSHLKTLIGYFRNDGPSIPDLTPSLIAERLGSFLIALYSLSVSSFSSVFHHPSGWDALNRYMIDSFPSNLKAMGIPEDDPILLPWRERVAATTMKAPSNPVLIFGDLWPNSLLIDADSSELWLLDWEMARFGHPLSDVRQMISNLYLMEVSPQLYRVDHVIAFHKALLHMITKEMKLTMGMQEQVECLALMVTITNNEFWKIENPAEMTRKACQEMQQILS